MHHPIPKLKSLHIIHSDGDGGGPNTVLNHVFYYLNSSDISWHYKILHGGQGRIARTCQQFGIPHHQIPLDKIWLAPLGVLSIIHQIHKFKPDVIFLHGQTAGIWGALAILLSPSIPAIYVTQWPSFYTDWDLYRVIRNYTVEWWPCRVSSSIVAISPGCHDEYLRRFPFVEKKLKYIPNAAPSTPPVIPEKKSALRTQLGWHPDLCHVLCASRISTQKRLDWLLEAWKIIEPQHPNARLWIAGSGELDSQIRRHAQNLNLQHCTFLGYRSDSRDLIAAADIVAMPTMYEGHANIPLEAMASGTPIVACEVDGVIGSFKNGQSGFLVPPADPAAFADAISQLIASPTLRQKMSESAALEIQKFNPSHVMQQYKDLILSLTAHPLKN